MFNTQNKVTHNKKLLQVDVLVHTVEGGVARVQLDGGEDSLTGWGTSSSSSISRCAGSVGSRGNSGKRSSNGGNSSGKRSSGISGNWGSSQGSNGGSSISCRGNSWETKSVGSVVQTSSVGSVVQTSDGSVVQTSDGSVVQTSSVGSVVQTSVGILSLSRSLGFLGSIESLEKVSLGSSNLSGVRHGKRCNPRVHGSNRCDTIEHGGNREVVTGHTEAKDISNVVYSVNTSLILVGVGASDTSEGIATLLLGTV